MGLEVEWGHLLAAGSVLTGAIGVLAGWFKISQDRQAVELKGSINDLNTKLAECEEKHLASAIKVASLEARFEQHKTLEQYQQNIVNCFKAEILPHIVGKGDANG
jgi:hypothetical protein